MEDLDRRVRLERLFADHATAIRAYARRRVGDAAADDVVSEVFVVAWRRLDDLPKNERAWLYGCASHVVSHQRRREARDVALVERLKGSVAAPAEGDALAQALGELSERDRELLMLIAWEGLRLEEAASVLGCSRGTVAVRLHRARRRLARGLHRIEASTRKPPTRAARKESIS